MPVLAPTLPEASQSGSSFLQLPPELRLQIYRSLLVCAGPIGHHWRLSSKPNEPFRASNWPEGLALLRTCQVCYHEGLAVLADENRVLLTLNFRERYAKVSGSVATLPQSHYRLRPGTALFPYNSHPENSADEQANIFPSTHDQYIGSMTNLVIDLNCRDEDQIAMGLYLLRHLAMGKSITIHLSHLRHWEPKVCSRSPQVCALYWKDTCKILQGRAKAVKIICQACNAEICLTTEVAALQEHDNTFVTLLEFCENFVRSCSALIAYVHSPTYRALLRSAITYDHDNFICQQALMYEQLESRIGNITTTYRVGPVAPLTEGRRLEVTDPDETFRSHVNSLSKEPKSDVFSTLRSVLKARGLCVRVRKSST